MEPNVTLLEPDSLLCSLMGSLIPSSEQTPCSDIPTNSENDLSPLLLAVDLRRHFNNDQNAYGLIKKGDCYEEGRQHNSINDYSIPGQPCTVFKLKSMNILNMIGL